MDKKKLLSFTKAVAPYLVCLSLCVVMAQAQDSITNLSHNARSSVETFAWYAGFFIGIIGGFTGWMRRSPKIAIPSLVVGGGLLIVSEIYNKLT